MPSKPFIEKTPSEVPVWFCGNASEWKLTREAVEMNGWSERKVKSLLSDQALRQMKGASRKDIEEQGSWSGAERTGLNRGLLLGMGLGAIVGPAVAGPGFTGFGFVVMSLLAGIPMSFGIGSIFAYLLTSKLKKIEKEDDSIRLANILSIPPERLSEIAKVTREAQAIMERQYEKGVAEGDDLALIQKVSAALDKVERDILKNNSQNVLMEELVKLHPSAFVKKGERETLKARLEGLGDAGGDGLAALHIWESLKDLTEMEIQERRRALTDRLPKLVSSFEEVPVEERTKPSEVLGGETPEGSLRRGLTALLDMALVARKAVTERKVIGVEAEARVNEEARGGFKI